MSQHGSPLVPIESAAAGAQGSGEMGMAKWLAWMALAGASLLVSDVSVADRSADSMTSARVKVALLNAEGIDGLAIVVKTLDGVVTLEGPVDSEAQKALVEATTLAVAGVRGVHNRLEVAPDAAGERRLDGAATTRSYAADRTFGR